MSTSISQSDIGNGDTNKEFEVGLVFPCAEKIADAVVQPNHSEDKIPSSPFLDLELTRSNGFPSPDPYVAATHDTEYLHLKENIRRIRKAPSGSDPKKVDHVWEVYKKVRDECLQLCQSLLHKSRGSIGNGMR
jgi:hypothetical protein